MRVHDDGDHFVDMLFSANGRGLRDDENRYLYVYGSLVDMTIRVGTLERAQGWIKTRREYYEANPDKAVKRKVVPA